MKNLITIILFTTLFSTPPVYAVEVSSQITASNDYRFRGISQTKSDPGMSATLDLVFDQGFVAGLWTGNIDFGVKGDIEVDYYAGYYDELNESTSFLITYAYYTYPGLAFDADFGELGGQLFYDNFTFEIQLTNDFAATDESALYIAANYNYPLANSWAQLENISLSLHAGYSSGDYWDTYDIGAYSDYSLGVGADFLGLNLSLNYLFNNIDTQYKNARGYFRNDNLVKFNISKTFNF